MDIQINEGFNIVYAKKYNRPQNIYCKDRHDVIKFFIDNLNDIDLIVINDIIIDKNKLVNNNKILSRYLKLKIIYNL